MSNVEKSWDRIHAWLGLNANNILQSLQEPANLTHISTLEDLVGTTLPQQLTELYSKHNGINPDFCANLIYGINFIPVENTIEQINDYGSVSDQLSLKYADAGIVPSYTFGKKRVPIADDSGACLLCVDLDPSEHGIFGQVILLDHDSGVALKLADSIDELLEKFAEDLESGKYTLLPEAMEDGNEWLEPAKEIDVVNWFNSPAWAHVKT